MAGMNSTRRGVLGAMAVVPVAIAAPAAAVAAGVTPELSRLIAAAEHVERLITQHNEGPWQAAKDRYDAMVQAIPHKTVQWHPTPHFAGETWTTANPDHVREARAFIDPKHTAPVAECQAFYQKACVELAGAADEREEKMAQARITSGLSQARDRDAELGKLSVTAEDAVINFPARTFADLAAKVEFAESRQVLDPNGSCWAVENIVADIRRIGRSAA